MKSNNLLCGLGGAVALSVIHESLKKTGNNMPRIDLLGEEAVQKCAGFLGCEFTNTNKLYATTLGADLAANGLFFSLIGAGKKENIWRNAIGLGLAAGIGALVLPQRMGLDPAPVNRNAKVGALTVAYYVAGALVTACALSKKNSGKKDYLKFNSLQ